MNQKKDYVLRWIPKYSIIPLITALVLNTLVYSGTMVLCKGFYHHDFTTAFDRMVPVIPEFTSIYLICYVFWVVNYIMTARISREHMYRFLTADYLSRIVCGIFFVFLPTTLVRPEITGTGFWDQALRFVYSIDQSANLFPSIHCLVSWFCYIGIRHQKKIPVWYQRFSLVFATLVCISTQVTKQHYISNTVFFFALFGLTAYAVLKGKELSELAEVLKSVKPAYYIAGLIMIVVFVCCESYIIYRMLRLLHYNDVPKRNCVKYSFVGFFFSCITPSATGGQPMQLYYMNRDKVDISVGTVILMIVTILYKFVLVFLGALIFLFRHFLVAEYIGKAAFFFYLGMALNVFCVAFMLILVFEPTLASKIVLWLFQKLEKFHILKKKEERLEKLQNSMIEYHKAAAIIQGHRIFIFRMFVVTLIQRLIHFSITYLVYRAMGLSALGFIDVVALQSVISISVDMLPLPGGMGISEGLFLNIFKKIFVGGLLYPAMLLSRGISYYALVLISAVMTGVAHVTIKRKE